MSLSSARSGPGLGLWLMYHNLHQEVPGQSSSISRGDGTPAQHQGATGISSSETEPHRLRAATQFQEGSGSKGPLARNGVR